MFVLHDPETTGIADTKQYTSLQLRQALPQADEFASRAAKTHNYIDFWIILWNSYVFLLCLSLY